MCLGHVYIVLEPVGSARLTFDDVLYYELCDLMTEGCLESRKRSRTCRVFSKWSSHKDHILEGCIRTPEWFRSFRMSFGVPGVTGTPHPPGSSWAFMGLSGKETRATREAAHPPMASPNWTREGAA